MGQLRPAVGACVHLPHLGMLLAPVVGEADEDGLIHEGLQVEHVAAVGLNEIVGGGERGLPRVGSHVVDVVSLGSAFLRQIV